MSEELRAMWLPVTVWVSTVVAVTAAFDLGAAGIYLGAFVGLPMAGHWGERRLARGRRPSG